MLEQIIIHAAAAVAGLYLLRFVLGGFRGGCSGCKGCKPATNADSPRTVELTIGATPEH